MFKKLGKLKHQDKETDKKSSPQPDNAVQDDSNKENNHHNQHNHHQHDQNEMNNSEAPNKQHIHSQHPYAQAAQAVPKSASQLQQSGALANKAPADAQFSKTRPKPPQAQAEAQAQSQPHADAHISRSQPAQSENERQAPLSHPPQGNSLPSHDQSGEAKIQTPRRQQVNLDKSGPQAYDGQFSSGSSQHPSQDTTTNRKTKNNEYYINDDDEKSDFKTPDIIVAASRGKEKNLPNPNKQGTVGSVPLERIHPERMKNAPSRNPNKFDTSISGPSILDDLTPEEKKQLTEIISSDNTENLFPWKAVTGFHPSGKGTADTKRSRVIKAYILENFYNDWFVNIVITLGTCFFAWAFAYMGFSWWSLGLIFFGTASVYRTEYRRFNRNLRDDLKRVTVDETISGQIETTIWLNSFLSKFWVIYMPVLSKQVKEIANPILAGVAPGYGIDALTLEEFTLGSKAPAIKGIKSYTKEGKDIVEMDWSFEFTPNDVSDMTPAEAREKVNPKISLGVTLGKSFVSKTLSVLVEDINVAGKVHITLQFGKIFPNIKIVSVQLLEPPLIDFVLKPLGGDTLGIDIMSFLPGLKTFVKKMIDMVAGPMLYAPNHLDINVEDIMAQQSNDAVGVLAVTLEHANNLVGSDFITNTVDPYISLVTEKVIPGEEAEIRTDVKSDITNPVWNETKYILINSLDQKLTLNCMDFNGVRNDQLIGSVEIPLNTFYQKSAIESATSTIKLGSKKKGTLNYSINYFPVIESSKDKKVVTENKPTDEEVMEDSDYDSDEEDSKNNVSSSRDSDAGILKFTLQKAMYLPTESSLTNSLSPCAELYLDNKIIKSYRTLRRINEPSWNETNEFFIPSKENSQLTIMIFDDRMSGKELLCRYSGYVDDIVAAVEAGQESFKASPQGEIFLANTWNPVELRGTVATSSSKNMSTGPLGSLRINVGKAKVNSTLSGVGDVDPYFTVALNKHVRYKSKRIPDTLEPDFETVIYVPISSESQILAIALADYQPVGSDRKIGSLHLPISQILTKDKESGEYSCKSQYGPDFHTLKLVNKNNKPTSDTIDIAFTFLRTRDVYSSEEIKDVEELETEMNQKKREFEKKQTEYKREMEKNPNDWEIVEVKDPFEDYEKKINAKDRLTFDELIQNNSGILGFNIVNGTLSNPSTYLQILVDSIPYPEFTSTKYRGNSPICESNNVMIRDLKNSKLLFRVCNRHRPKEKSDVLAEAYLSTLDLLKKGYDNPTKITFKDNTLNIKFSYFPTTVSLPANESVLDTGILSVNLISASNLMSADRNGYSDPFVYLYVDGNKLHKSQIVKKSLNPVWNEKFEVPIISKSRSKIILRAMDWDRAGDNDDLGEVLFDSKSIVPGKPQDWELPLNTQGTIRCQTIFSPQYIKPEVEYREKGLGNSVPLKAVGAVGGAGVNVVSGTAGAVTGVATGGFKAGGQIFKSLGGNKLMGGRRSEERRDKGRRSEERRDRDTTLTEDSDDIPLSSGQHAGDITSSSAMSQHSNGGESHFSKHTDRTNHTGHHSRFGVPGVGGILPHSKNTPKGQRSRSSSTLTSGRGKVSVLAATDLGKNIEVKVSLVQGDKVQQILKTNTGKSDSNGSVYYQGETGLFQSGADGILKFEAIESHSFSKNKEIGEAKISLVNPAIKGGEKAAVDIQNGRIIFQVEYNP